MTVTEILEQAKALSPEERKELAKHLIDMIDTVPSEKVNDTKDGEHWGKSLNKLLDDLNPVLKYSEIEDPVEWVKHLRSQEQKHRVGDWDDIE